MAKKGTAEKIDPMIGEKLKKLLRDKNVKVYVCEEAAQKRAIGKDDLESAISIVGYATFLGMATEAKVVITI